MSAVPRDQLFWKRFATAIRQDEEQGVGKPELKHSYAPFLQPSNHHREPSTDLLNSDSWLARQQGKRSRRAWVCCTFWLLFFLFVAAVVALVIWLLKSGILHMIELGNGNGTPNQPADPNGSA